MAVKRHFFVLQVSAMRSLNEGALSPHSQLSLLSLRSLTQTLLAHSPHSNTPNSQCCDWRVCSLRQQSLVRHARAVSPPAVIDGQSQSRRDDFTLKNGSKRVLFCPPGVNNEKPINSNSLPNSLCIYLSPLPTPSSLKLSPTHSPQRIFDFFGVSVRCASSL